MRRSALLLAMLAALTGSPLRQAEAASDLSRLLADLSEAADFETPDGGVGDDSGVGTLADSLGRAADAAADVVLFLLPPPATFIASPCAGEGLRERVWWPQSPPAVRFAWLQTFRF